MLNVFMSSFCDDCVYEWSAEKFDKKRRTGDDYGMLNFPEK
jgi:hypothetical protein